MDPLIFVDSNVLLYSIDSRNHARQKAAHRWMEALWSAGAARLSWQVIHEYYANATGKFAVDPAIIRVSIEPLAKLCTTPIDLSLLQSAWQWEDRADISYWDSLILAAAERQDCTYLLSEDFQPGRKYGPVTVINPFHHSPNEFLA